MAKKWQKNKKKFKKILKSSCLLFNTQNTFNTEIKITLKSNFLENTSDKKKNKLFSTQ